MRKNKQLEHDFGFVKNRHALERFILRVIIQRR
jgi:hypothetical protein